MFYTSCDGLFALLMVFCLGFTSALLLAAMKYDLSSDKDTVCPLETCLLSEVVKLHAQLTSNVFESSSLKIGLYM